MHYLLTGKPTATAFVSGDRWQRRTGVDILSRWIHYHAGSHAPRGFNINTSSKLVNCPFQVVVGLQEESLWDIEVKDYSHNHGPSLDASVHDPIIPSP
jgi:hypothetical protein